MPRKKKANPPLIDTPVTTPKPKKERPLVKRKDGKIVKKGGTSEDWRTDEQRELDRVKIANMIVLGWTQAEIANQLGMTKSTVSRDVKAIRAEWAKSRIEDYNLIVDRARQRNDLILREAWEGWQRSKEDIETRSQTGGEGIAARVSIKRQRQPGDPAFLKVMSECIDRDLRMSGASQTLNVNVSGQVVHAHVDGLTDLFRQMRESEKGERDAIVVEGRLLNSSSNGD